MYGGIVYRNGVKVDLIWLKMIGLLGIVEVLLVMIGKGFGCVVGLIIGYFY